MKGLELLSKVALSFRKASDFDRDMQQVLEDVGNFMAISRIYIVYNETDKIMKNTFEWCNEGVTSQMSYLQEVHYEDVPSWYPVFVNQGYLCSDNIMELPEDLVAVLQPQGIKSILVYPLWVGGVIKGFIGFDECDYIRKWKKEELKTLSTISGIITNAYERKEFQETLQESEKRFSKFFSVGLDLFCMTDSKGRFIKTNEAWKEMLGYSVDDLQERTITDFIHPEDLSYSRLCLDKIGRGERVPNLINRYIASSGEYHYLEWRVISYGGGFYAAARDVTERMAYPTAPKPKTQKESWTT